MKVEKTKNWKIIFLFFIFIAGTSTKLPIDISRLLLDQKYPSGDQIKGLEVSCLMDPVG